MTDFGGLAGALMLSDQISTDRLLDSLRRAREANSLALNDAAWRNQYNDLVNRYNQLLHDANRLADLQDRGMDAQAAHIAELKVMNATLTAEIDQLRFRIVDLESKVAFLREFQKQLCPDAYQYLSFPQE